MQSFKEGDHNKKQHRKITLLSIKEIGRDHQKSKTQNINIFNIIRGNNLYGTRKNNAASKTYEISSQLNKHDNLLEQQLKEYKAEIEMRFNSSKINLTYIFPRTNTYSHEDIKLSGKAIVVSIYDDCIAPLIEERRIKLTNGLKNKERIINFIKELLRTKEITIPLYKTQRFKEEPFKKPLHKKVETISHSEELVKRKLPLILRLSNKKLHRTNTVNDKDFPKNKHIKTKSRTNTNKMQFSDYFRKLVGRQKCVGMELSSRAQIKTREHNQLISTLSVPNFICTKNC